MLNIAIDGLAGSGKSSLAKNLAKALNIHHFNTGNVYRAIACEYLNQFGEEVTENNISKLLENIDVQVQFVNDKQVCLVNGRDYEKDLRTEKTSSFVPKISHFSALREVARKIQRDFALENNCVMEGRDIGSVVLKDAQFKIFLTASAEVRADRRFKEVKDESTYEEVLDEIKKRDYQDMHREDGALTITEDSIVVDSSNMNKEQVLDHCLKIIRGEK